MQSIILGSNSPTRANILRENGICFTQRDTGFNEEKLHVNTPSHFAYYATLGKIRSYIEKFDLDRPVLCADTIVMVKNKLLRKAKNVNDAREMLLRQSGETVCILTCMILKSKKLELIDFSESRYVFSSFNLEKLEEYLKTNEYRGKAGACMIEGFCKDYIQEIIGYESTAKGLCIEKLIPFLKNNDVC